MGFSRQEYWSGVPLPSPPIITSEIKFIILKLFPPPKSRPRWLHSRISCNQYWVFHYYLTRQIFNQVEYCKLRSIFTTVSKVTFEYLKEKKIQKLIFLVFQDYRILRSLSINTSIISLSARKIAN